MSFPYHIVILFNLSNQLTVNKLNFTITTKFYTKTDADEAAAAKKKLKKYK